MENSKRDYIINLGGLKAILRHFEETASKFCGIGSTLKLGFKDCEDFVELKLMKVLKSPNMTK